MKKKRNRARHCFSGADAAVSKSRARHWSAPDSSAADTQGSTEASIQSSCRSITHDSNLPAHRSRRESRRCA